MSEVQSEVFCVYIREPIPFRRIRKHRYQEHQHYHPYIRESPCPHRSAPSRPSTAPIDACSHRAMIRGVASNIPFQAALLAHPDFVAGAFDTGFIAAHYGTTAVAAHGLPLKC